MFKKESQKYFSGKLLGFGIAFAIFISIFYYLSSKYLHFSEQITYLNVILGYLILFFIFVLIKKRKQQSEKGSFREMTSGFTKGFQDFGYHVTNVVNFILLFIVYFVGIGPTSIVMKLKKKEFLDLRSFKKKETYWVDNKITKQPIDEYYRQF